MAKISQKNKRTSANSTANANGNGGKKSGAITKAKRTRKSVQRDSPPQRSSIYRGVTRHRWTGRFEAHLWDKNCWNESQNKKGRQVYLGAYDDEEAAAHSYDLAALKYWGQDTILNFPLETYQDELKEMEGQSKEEYIGSLRRKSSGFSRGVSKYRGVARCLICQQSTPMNYYQFIGGLLKKLLCRHHHNGRWEARIGRVFGNKYLYLGTYATQEEAATAYDMAAIEYRGLNAVTNFDLSRYINWPRPNQSNPSNPTNSATNLNPPNFDSPDSIPNPNQDELGLSFFFDQQPPETSSSGEISFPALQPSASDNASSALGLLLQSSKFKEMLEITSAGDSPSSPPESDPPRSSFPDDIQTYFDCQDSGSYADGVDSLFADLNEFPMFCDLDA